MLVLAATLALGVIWERQQNSTLASQVRKLEDTLETAQRKHRYIAERFAQAHMPANLTRMAGEALVMPAEHQVVWLVPQQRMPEIEQPLQREPFQSTYELALLELNFGN